MMAANAPARTYNQNHIPRRYTPGQRRVSIYIAWSFPAEAGQNTAELNNRFSTLTEVRRIEWPNWEEPQWSDPLQFQQGIAGGLELFFRAWIPFQNLAGEIYEWWLHAPTNTWFIARRNTVTDNILETMTVDAYFARQAQDVSGSAVARSTPNSQFEIFERACAHNFLPGLTPGASR